MDVPAPALGKLIVKACLWRKISVVSLNDCGRFRSPEDKIVIGKGKLFETRKELSSRVLWS